VDTSLRSISPQDLAARIGRADAPLPLVRRRPDLGVTGEAPSRWITRERPKIDRIACPWLVRRFIDPAAELFCAAALPLYDALYAWCRDAAGERHGWNPDLLVGAAP